MSQEHQNDVENKGWDLQAVSDKCLSKFRAKKMAFLVGLTGRELGEDPHW